MRALISFAIAFLVIATIGLTGCAGSGIDPVSPDDGLPYTELSSDDPGQRVLWGIWSVGFDPGSMSATAIPSRDLQTHYDITGMLLPPKCDDCLEIAINSFDPVTRILDVNINLRNKSALTGYDVRGILYTNDFGHELRNADDWTNLWDIAGGNEINPFRAFVKNEPDRAFIPDAENHENYLIYIPQPPQWNEITFAVDVSWPINCKEPYSIENFNQTGFLFDTGNSSTGVEVEVLDWQDDVDEVLIFAAELTGETSTPFTNQGGNLWMLNLVNSQGISAGQYEFLLKATSSNSGTLPLYDFVKVTVIPSGSPVNPVDVTPPWLNTTPHDGCVDGDYLYIAGYYNGLSIFDITDPADPVWVNKVEPLIGTDHVAVMDGYAYVIDRYSGSTLCVYDVDPPENAYLIATMDLVSAYDITASDGYVYLINSGRIYIFDVETPDDPQLLIEYDVSCDFCELTDITVSGDYLYLSHSDWWYYSTGIRIYDISTPGNPIYVTHLGSDVDPGPMVIKDGYMFVATYQGLQISDIDPPEDGYLIKTIDTFGEPFGFETSGDFAYVTGYKYEEATLFSLEIIDISDPESAYIVNSIDPSSFLESAGVKDGHLILTDRNYGLEIIDVDPPGSAGIVNNINQPGYYITPLKEGYLWSANFRSADIYDVAPPESTFEVNSHLPPSKQIYFGVDSSDGYACIGAGIFFYGPFYLYIYDIEPPETSSVVNSVEIGSDSYNIGVSGGYAYALTDEVPGVWHLEIIDIDPPESAQVVNNVELSGHASGLTVSGGYVYILNKPDSQDITLLSIMDITPPETAYIVSEVELGEYATSVVVSGAYAYVCGQAEGIHVVDINPPELADVVTTIVTPSNALDVDVSGDYIYIAAKDDLLIYNKASIADIFLVSSIASKGENIFAVDVSANYAYLYDRFYGVRIIELWE